MLKYHDTINTNAIPPIITKNTFDKAQERMRKNQSAPGFFKAKGKYLLAGKLFCGKCGEKMVGITGNSKTGRVYHYYKCKNAHKHKCDMKQLWKDETENAVISVIFKVIGNERFLEEVVDKLLTFQGKDTPVMKILKDQRKEVEKQIDNIVEAMKKGIYTKTTKKALEDLERQQDVIDQSISKKAVSNPSLEREDIINALRVFISSVSKEQSTKRMFIHRFVNSVFLEKDNKTLGVNICFFGTSTRKRFTIAKLNGVCISDGLVRHGMQRQTLWIFNGGFGFKIEIQHSRKKKSWKARP